LNFDFVRFLNKDVCVSVGIVEMLHWNLDLLQILVIADNVAYYFKITLCLVNLGVYGDIWCPKGILQTL